MSSSAGFTCSVQEQAIFETNDDYEVKTAQTLDDACKLLEVRFEYVTDIEGKKLFRKRK